MSSGAIFPRAYNFADSPKDSRQTVSELVKQAQNTLKIESSSCPCSPILIRQRKEILQKVFRIPKRSRRITQGGFSLDIGHSSVWEKKTNGMERTITNLKESEI